MYARTVKSKVRWNKKASNFTDALPHHALHHTCNEGASIPHDSERLLAVLVNDSARLEVVAGVLERNLRSQLHALTAVRTFFQPIETKEISKVRRKPKKNSEYK